MKNKRNIISKICSLIVMMGLVLCPMSVFAAESDEIVIQNEDGSTVVMTPLSEEETLQLLEQADQVQPQFDNAVYAAPVKVDSNNVAVDFTNIGFPLDFVDYVQTNLIVWHAQDNNPVGWRIDYYKLPFGTHRTGSKYVANWHSAQTIGGYYIDGFGTEVGIGGASGIIYN